MKIEIGQSFRTFMNPEVRDLEGENANYADGVVETVSEKEVVIRMVKAVTFGEEHEIDDDFTRVVWELL